MIAITFALPTESSAFLRRLGNKSRTDRLGIKTIRGKIGDCSIEVLHTGVGEKICRQRMASFLQDQQFDCLISAGFAGSLNDQLKIGGLFLAENFSTAQFDDACSALSNLPIHRGNLLTVPALIESSEERNKVARESGAAAIDMETEFIARACAEHAIPLLSLRVISDTPDEPFPAPTKVLFNITRQRTLRLKLATYFLAHPNRIPRLVAFAKRIAHARKTLADALVAVATAL
jgi:adenosylhomocysteine nucleosidase